MFADGMDFIPLFMCVRAGVNPFFLFSMLRLTMCECGINIWISGGIPYSASLLFETLDPHQFLK